MPSSRYVSTAKELKKALDDKVDFIVITDKKLAFAARVIKATGYKALAVTAAAAGVAAVSIWNPAGWFSGAAAGTAGATALISGFTAIGGVGAAAAAGISGGTAAVLGTVVVVLGVIGLAALVMHKDYHWEIDSSAGGKIDSSEATPAAKGNASFKMTLKRNGS
ncbi:hypothetical protein ACNFCJ_06820 [Pseudomonas sp. NY15364]|uniref:hypothetical protein n=1 Tax=Pseudomonas sp. NY15364 TaxID=3400353 RepID=UPI003A8A5E59